MIGGLGKTPFFNHSFVAGTSQWWSNGSLSRTARASAVLWEAAEKYLRKELEDECKNTPAGGDRTGHRTPYTTDEERVWHEFLVMSSSPRNSRLGRAYCEMAFDILHTKRLFSGVEEGSTPFSRVVGSHLEHQGFSVHPDLLGFEAIRAFSPDLDAGLPHILLAVNDASGHKHVLRRQIKSICKYLEIREPGTVLRGTIDDMNNWIREQANPTNAKAASAEEC